MRDQNRESVVEQDLHTNQLELLDICQNVGIIVIIILGGGFTEIDMLTSRLWNQLPSYYSWKPDPNSLSTDVIQQKWS